MKTALFSLQYESMLLLGLMIMVVFLLIIVTFSWSHQKKRGKEETRQFAVHNDYQKKLHEIRIQQEENERFKFARILQKQVDEMTISIAGIKELAKCVTEEEFISKLAVLTEKLESTRRNIEEICREITPAMLLESGLSRALESLASQYNKSGNSDIYFSEKGYKKQDDLTEIMLFRIAEEIISNALKHGKPNRIDMRLKSDEEKIELEICDNGLPFDLKKNLKDSSLTPLGNGLKDMESRLQNNTDLYYTHSEGMNRNTLVCRL